MTHTPGPWHVVAGSRDPHDGGFYVKSAAGTVTRLDSQSSAVDEANAKLIAAAPELLLACKLAAMRYERMWGRPKGGSVGIEARTLEAAIASAEGRP